MRVAIVVIAVVPVAAGIVLACGDSTTGSAPPSSSPEGGIPGADSSPGDAPAGPTDDSGVQFAPDGCRLITTGYLVGLKAENVARTDITNAVNWTNVTAALVDDTKFATVTLNDGQESAELRVSQFNVNVPSNAETWGIEVELKRQAPNGGILDGKVNLIMGTKPVQFKFFEPNWPTTIVGTHHYGQAVDTWGVDLYPSDVDTPSFAATLTVKRALDAGSGPVIANVDSIKVAVHYCTK
jgi:hypothetical protein